MSGRNRGGDERRGRSGRRKRRVLRFARQGVTQCFTRRLLFAQPQRLRRRVRDLRERLTAHFIEPRVQPDFAKQIAGVTVLLGERQVNPRRAELGDPDPDVHRVRVLRPQHRALVEVMLGTQHDAGLLRVQAANALEQQWIAFDVAAGRDFDARQRRARTRFTYAWPGSGARRMHEGTRAARAAANKHERPPRPSVDHALRAPALPPRTVNRETHATNLPALARRARARPEQSQAPRSPTRPRRAARHLRQRARDTAWARGLAALPEGTCLEPNE